MSLIEASMVLALSAVVIAGAVAYYQNASQRSKAVATNGAFQTVVSTIDSMYSTRGTYATLTAKSLVQSGALPANLVDLTNDLIRLPHGGTTTLVGADKTYKITLGDVPKNICNVLALNDFGPNKVSFTIGGKAVTTPEEAISSCDDKGKGVEMVWELR